jgi:hypothetical protein
LTLKHGGLLAQSGDFEGGLASCTDENPECNQRGEEELAHELTVVTWRNAGSLARSEVFSTH